MMFFPNDAKPCSKEHLDSREVTKPLSLSQITQLELQVQWRRKTGKKQESCLEQLKKFLQVFVQLSRIEV